MFYLNIVQSDASASGDQFRWENEKETSYINQYNPHTDHAEVDGTLHHKEVIYILHT